MPSSHLTRRMDLRLRELEMDHQVRQLRSTNGTNLCSNDYLGLASDPRLKAALLNRLASVERVASTGSRLLSGHHPAWEEIEEEFAAFAGTEAALFFSSGYAANTGLLSSLLKQDDVVFSDALNHASIIDGIRLSHAQKVIYPHADLNFLESALRQHSNRSGAKVIVTETIFSMDGDCAPLAGICQLAARYGAEVILDEAHATGVCGPQGRGLAADLGVKPLATVHTCGKALASMGAFVCGTKILQQFLVNDARSFMFSTALPPYFAHQVSTALSLAISMDAERNHLAALSAHLRSRLRDLGYRFASTGTHIVPAIAGSNERALGLAALLEARGFAVRAIRPPTVPQGTARLRLSLTAQLTVSAINRLVDSLAVASSIEVGHV
jgi:8-amino-7-oxononanoate synthase